MGKLTLKWTGLFAAALVAVACDRQSDPMKDYPELARDVPVAQAKENDQTFDGLLFDIRVQGKRGNISELQFEEGKETTYTVLVRGFMKGLDYKLVPHDFPKDGPRLESTSRKDTYLIKWAPAKGAIPKGLTSQSVEVKLEFAIDSNSSAAARVAFERDKRDRLTNYTLTVSLPDSEPTIKVVGLDKTEYKKYDVVDFTVEVTDVNASKARQPRVSIDAVRNESNEVKTYPLVALFDHAKGARFENNKWIFPFKLDTSFVKEEYIRPNSGYATGEFLVYVVNPASRKDAELKKRIKVVPPQGAVQ